MKMRREISKTLVENMINSFLGDESACTCYLERIEEFDDVCCRSYVDEEKLGQLVPRHVPLWQHPAADDENEHEKLFDDDHQGVIVHRNRNVLQVGDRQLEKHKG